LIANTEDGDAKTEMIRSLAVYMRQQYLIWNKDTVSDQTIFQDIVKLSGDRITIPEGMELSRLDNGANYSRPGQNQSKGNKNQWQKNNQKNRKQHK
jgi:hypothetical protein